MARSSRSIAITRFAPSASSARVRPPGPGPTSMTVAPSSGPAARAMRPVKVQIEKEVLAERLLGGQSVPADHIAQRRQLVAALMTSSLSRSRPKTGTACRGHGFGGERPLLALSARKPASSAATRLDGSALPVPAMSKAVPWSGDVRTKGKPERDVDGMIEGQRLDRDQRLVVIHAQRCVVARRAASWNMVSAGRGPRASMPSATSRSVAGSTTVCPPRPSCRLRRRGD